MIGFIRKILSRKSHIYYDKCYKEKEKEGRGVFKCCCGEAGGDSHTEGLSYTCVSCPYLVLKYINRKENKND